MRTRLLVLVDVNWFSRPLGQMTSSRGSERAPENYLRLCSPSWIPAPRSHTGNWATLTETQLNAYPHARCERGLWCTPGRLATRVRPDFSRGRQHGAGHGAGEREAKPSQRGPGSDHAEHRASTRRGGTNPCTSPGGSSGRDEARSLAVSERCRRHWPNFQLALTALSLRLRRRLRHVGRLRWGVARGDRASGYLRALHACTDSRSVIHPQNQSGRPPRQRE